MIRVDTPIGPVIGRPLGSDVIRRGVAHVGVMCGAVTWLVPRRAIKRMKAGK